MSPLGYWWKWRQEGSYLKESGGGQGEETSPNPTAKLWREAPLKPAGQQRVTPERREQTGEAMSTDDAQAGVPEFKNQRHKTHWSAE